jgi:hypothetical protein
MQRDLRMDTFKNIKNIKKKHDFFFLHAAANMSLEQSSTRSKDQQRQTTEFQ